MAKLIRADGTEQSVSPKNGTFKLDELYALIGGGCDMVECITLADGVTTMWLDEEGKFRGTQRPNAKASELLRLAGGMPGDTVMGNVLVCEEGEVD
jgi:hypothetical protein